jgi:hypothetical protein
VVLENKNALIAWRLLRDERLYDEPLSTAA